MNFKYLPGEPFGRLKIDSAEPESISVDFLARHSLDFTNETWKNVICFVDFS
jgi:hypothetical protein